MTAEEIYEKYKKEKGIVISHFPSLTKNEVLDMMQEYAKEKWNEACEAQKLSCSHSVVFRFGFAKEIEMDTLHKKTIDQISSAPQPEFTP